MNAFKNSRSSMTEAKFQNLILSNIFASDGVARFKLPRDDVYQVTIDSDEKNCNKIDSKTLKIEKITFVDLLA